MVIDREKAIAIGEGLRITRESKSLTLSDVSAKLKIRKLYLQKLESGEVEEIPGSVYQKLYLKTYCDFLDVMEENFPILPSAGNENVDILPSAGNDNIDIPELPEKKVEIKEPRFIDKLKEQKRPTKLVLGVSAAVLLAMVLYYNF